MANKRILTLEQLVQFCEKSNLKTFSAKDTGYTLSVTIPATFGEEVNSDKGILYAPIRICHTLLNRNGSFISEENMKRAMPSLKYRPFLATIHQLDDGSWDFHSHDINIIKDENGEEDFEYIEKQVGCITADEPYLEYDKEMDKTYVVGKVAIPEDYTRCADILREKKTSKVSCELNIESMSYNGKEHRLELEDFYFTGVTALGREKDGTEIGEGMLGSKVSIEDFSTNNNSVFSHIDESDTNKLFELLSSINSKLDKFENTDNQKEGGQIQNMTKFEELLQKYNKTVEDVTFDYEGLSDDELEAVFAENFGEAEPSNDPEPEPTEPEPTDPVEPEEGNEPDEPTTVVNSLEPMIRTYEISHEDTRYALYALLSSYEEADNEWYFINNVFDSYFTYENWNGDKVYGQAYTKDGDNVAFDGERYNLHRELLTDSEYAELQSMRSNYASIKEKADKYDYSVLESERVAEFAKIDYSSISDKPEFVELAKEEKHKDFSLDEVKSKLNDIILSYAKAGQLSFAATEPKKKAVNVTRLPLNDGKSAKRSRYGNLFSKN